MTDDGETADTVIAVMLFWPRSETRISGRSGLHCRMGHEYQSSTHGRACIRIAAELNSLNWIKNDPASSWMQNMSANEFDQLLHTVNGLLPEQMRRLRDELDSRIVSSASAGRLELTPEELSEQELQRRLVAAGLLSEIKPPPR